MKKTRRALEETVEHMKWLKMDGVPNILRSHYILLSLIWLLMLIGNAGVCTWLIVESFTQYSEHKVTTTTRYLSEQQSVFPTIVICNVNPFSTNAAVSFLKAAKIQTFNGTTLGSIQGNYDIYVSVQKYLNSSRGYYMTDEEKMEMSDIDGMLYGCSFQGVACNSSSFSYFFHPYFLTCYRFNDNGSQSMSMTGPTVQLNLEIYVGLPNAMTSTYARGLYVFMLNATEYPYDYTMSPYIVSPGNGMIIVPQRQFYSQYPTPYSDCNVREDNELSVDNLADKTLFWEVVDTEYDYSQRACFSFCQQMLTVEKCGCMQFKILYTIDGYDYCMSTNETTCQSSVNSMFTTGTYRTDNCLAYCPNECVQRLFKPTISTYTYPTSVSYQTYLKNLSSLASKYSDQADYTDHLSQCVVQVLVYYDMLAYIQVEEEPKMTAEDLLGILGGHLHLFLGMSLLSFVEVIELFILFIASIFKPHAVENF